MGNGVIADGRWEQNLYSKGKSYDRMAPKGQSQTVKFPGNVLFLNML